MKNTILFVKHQFANSLENMFVVMYLFSWEVNFISTLKDSN